jgi:alkylation response protein AidB-like acyl-CoA dehydrogenase
VRLAEGAPTPDATPDRRPGLYADTRVQRIHGGTSEVMKTIIAKDLGL